MHAVSGEQRVVAGRYLLTSRIGRGAMGTVWRARDPVLARDVAVKEIQVPGLLTREEREVLQQRTLREARAAARLNHPGVVKVFDVVEGDGNPWIVMELVEARSLEQVLADDGPLPPEQAAEMGAMVLGALACAHAAGIMHRDVKPSNVLLSSEGRAVLTDFGIATLEGDPGLTQAGMVMGTPGFCAPERLRGEPATPASDLWSLGATLYAAVEGHGPFAGRSTPMAVLAAVANEEAPPARKAGPLEPLITALLQREAAQRPRAAAAQRLLATAGRPGAGGLAPAALAGPAGSLLITPPAAAALLSVPPPTGAPPAAAAAGAWHPPWAAPASGSSSARLPAALPAGARPGPARAQAARDSQAYAKAGQHARPGQGSPAGRAWSWPSWAVLAAAGAALAGAGLLIGFLASVAAHGRRLPPAAGQLAPRKPARRAAVTPPGYRWLPVPGPGTGSAAAFSLAVPRSWHSYQSGQLTIVQAPARPLTLTVDRAPLGTASIRAAARLRQRHAQAAGGLAGYRTGPLRMLRLVGGPAASWTLSWDKPGTGQMRTQEVVFTVPTPAGRRSWRLRLTAPAADWHAGKLVLAAALRTLHAGS